MTDMAHFLQYDTPPVRAGAVQYVKCGNCGAEPGAPCKVVFYQDLRGRAIPDFAHIARRMEYHEWQDVYGPATIALLMPTADYHPRPRLVEPERACGKPRRHCETCSQCVCGAQLSAHSEKLEEKKSSADVDDLLG